METKNADIGEGAKVPHLSYIGDAEIGAGANIGAGSITANYDGKAKHRTTIGPEARIASNTVFVAPVEVTEAILEALAALTPLAPLHQPRCLSPIRAIKSLRPRLKQIACFDTAFHHGLAAPVSRFAIPRHFEEMGIRRYGFHGLSFEFIARRLAEISPALADKRTVVAHLGNGASLCAMRNGRSADTTMGLTPLDGLMMGTRCGAIDPGVLLYLQQEQGISTGEVEQMLYQESGLLGVSGVSADMRVLLASDDPRASDAIDLFDRVSVGTTVLVTR